MKSLLKSILFIIPPIFALLLALLVGMLFAMVLGHNPLRLYAIMWNAAFGSWDGFGYVLFNMIPLIFTGLSVALAFRAGLFNIGAEGQLYIGAFFCAWVGFTFVGLPALILIPLCILAAMLGGAFWGAIPGVLKARFGVHEVIITIMLNMIALYLINFLVNNVYKEAGQMIPQTRAISESARLPRLGAWGWFAESNPINASLFIALIMVILVSLLLWKTRLGYELRVVGANPKAAEYAGMNKIMLIETAMALSGGIAGLVGVSEVLAYRHRFLDNFSGGIGFTGIAVALLGRNHPFGVIVASFLFAVLNVGALDLGVYEGIPRELVIILQALIIIFLIIGHNVFTWLFNKLNLKAKT